MTYDDYQASQDRDWHQAKVVVIVQLAALIVSIGTGFFWLGTVSSDLDSLDQRQNAHEIMSTEQFKAVDTRITREMQRAAYDTDQTRQTLRRIEEKIDRFIEGQVSPD